MDKYNEPIRHGYYTKHFNLPSENIILSFDADSNLEDTHFTAGKFCNTTGFQVVETRKEMPGYDFTYNNDYIKDIEIYYNTLMYSFYNIYGQRVKSMLVKFDFENNTITVNGRTVPIESDGEFVYKILKNKVKALDGINGFYKHVLESMHVNSAFNSRTWGILCKIGDIQKE